MSLQHIPSTRIQAQLLRALIDAVRRAGLSWEVLTDDLGEKREDYAKGGLAEYWVADVAAKTVIRHADPGRPVRAAGSAARPRPEAGDADPAGGHGAGAGRGDALAA